MRHVGPGHVIAGKYRLDHRLGEGGMGSVWSAEHLDLQSKVAIKLIVPDHADDPTVLSRFVREARAAASLRSPHVVQILDYGVDDGLAYIAMEELEGESLRDRLRREPRLTPALTVTIVSHLARAIAKAREAGLVHRDLKPDNVFLVQNDDDIVVKVLDFGIAKAHSDGEAPASVRTETGVVVGSPFYMSPEQARGRRDVDYRSDLWSIGVIAYECLVGERPFTGESIGEVLLVICTEPLPVPSAVAPVPAAFDGWFRQACERDVARRFQSPKELASAIRKALTPGGEASVDESVPPVPAAEPFPDEDASLSELPTTRVDGSAPPEPLRIGGATPVRAHPGDPVLAASGRIFGSTTTTPTSHGRSSPSAAASPGAGGNRRLGAGVAAFVILAAAVAWFSASRRQVDVAAASAAASASKAVPAAAERTSTVGALPEITSVVPAVASVAPSSRPVVLAPASVKRVTVAERPKAKAAPLRKVNPLDIRF